ncbi:hypothetical protein PHYC_01789 [Phycisphaerales bacterium]|nr:hypothetical protein PHYC_01789 [Phycisphaerales bacterium]
MPIALALAVLALQPAPRGHFARIDLPAVRATLLAAPDELGAGPGVVVLLPMPDGGFEHFEVRRSPVMDPGLAARYPEIQTYIAHGLDDPGAAARLDLSPAGLHAIVRGAKGAALIGPDAGAGEGGVVSRRWQDSVGFWDCGINEGHDLHAQAGDAGDDPYQPRGPQPLRTYRFAMACTGEFAAFYSDLQGHAPNVTDALAAVVTITNRVNFVLEQDMAVRLLLVPNNDLLIFLDPDTDPYDAVSSGANLSANISTCDAIIGNANFDLGHLVTRIPGGVAYLNAACGSAKAGGVSGIPRTVTPEIDWLSGEVVMHEVGHQLGANHTFNGSVDRCLGNRNGSTAWEPGSGTTIMAYPGGCPVGNDPPGDNIQIYRDVMYHHGSIGEMRNFTNGNGAACSALVTSGNTPPAFVSLTTSGLSIPRLTPFTLSGVATDIDGDTLTYSWEQRDVGPQQPLHGEGSEDNGTSPLFRVFAPVTSGSRLFPELADCLSGVPDATEEMPSAAPFSRRFRLTVRDNFAGTGGVIITSNINVLIAAGTGPFRVTEPLLGTVATPGPLTVRWDVAGTDAPPIGTTTVSIDLSVDGGATFPYSLATSAPNNGAAAVTLPNAWAGEARIRVRANGNIYLAFSPAFSIQYCDPDVNCDGSINGFDIEATEQAVNGDFSNFCQASADLNGDGAENGFDIESEEQRVNGAPC